MLTLYFTTWSSITVISKHYVQLVTELVTSFFVSVNLLSSLMVTQLPTTLKDLQYIALGKKLEIGMCTLSLPVIFSLESGILNSTAVRGHDCYPEAVQNLKRIKLGMCMLYITCTVIFPSRCALDGHCMAPLGDTRPCECGLFIRDVCQLNFLPVC